MDSPHPFSRRIRMTFRVVGHSISDRLLRCWIGDRVGVSITSWGGTVLIVTADFRHARSQMLSFIEPLDAEHSIQNVLVYANKLRLRTLGWLLDPFRLGVAPLFHPRLHE